jgi:hypothetical protein
MSADSKGIDLGHYDPDGEYSSGAYEPFGLFFDEGTAAKFRKVKAETLRFVVPEIDFKGHCVRLVNRGRGRLKPYFDLLSK